LQQNKKKAEAEYFIFSLDFDTLKLVVHPFHKVTHAFMYFTDPVLSKSVFNQNQILVGHHHSRVAAKFQDTSSGAMGSESSSFAFCRCSKYILCPVVASL
jgi:hypothetical protein